MSREAFQQHLNRSIESLIKFTGEYCHNILAENYKFVIEPSGTDYHRGMDEFAKRNLDTMLRFKNKRLSEEELMDLLYIDGSIPNWINISVYKSNKELTLIHILATREWRPYHKAEADFPKMEIFHSQVSLPSEYDKISGKFDVNWKYDMVNSKHIWDRIKDIFNW